MFLYILFNVPSLKNRLSKYGINVYPFIVYWRKLCKKERVNIVNRRIKLIVNVYAFIAVAVLAYLMIEFYNLIINFGVINILRKVTAGNVSEIKSPIAPIVPGITIPFEQFIYISLGIAIGVLVHELGHALIAIYEGVKLSGWGLGIFIIFPFAFIEPAEEAFKKSRTITKLKILSAGVLNNMLVALLITFLILPQLFNALSTYQVLIITSTIPDSPAFNSGLFTPSILISINNTEIRSISELRNYLMRLINKSVTLIVNVVLLNGSLRNYTINKPANVSLLGIYVYEDVKMLIERKGGYEVSDPPELPLTRLAMWTYIVNYSLAIINAAPLLVTDGGRYVNEILRKILGEKKGGGVSTIIQVFTIALTAVLLIIGLIRGIGV